MQVYLVGGAVRDGLLARPIKDRDFVVVGSSVEQMLEAGFLQVGSDFPVFLHPKTKEEYALARTERKSGRPFWHSSYRSDEERFGAGADIQWRIFRLTCDPPPCLILLLMRAHC